MENIFFYEYSCISRFGLVLCYEWIVERYSIQQPVYRCFRESGYGVCVSFIFFFFLLLFYLLEEEFDVK